MAQEEDFSKLSIEDKVNHKAWKARVMGYEEAIKHFKKQDDENSPEYNVYAGLLKKFVIDSNAAAQEKGVEATLAFLESAAASIGGRVVADVMAGVVTKCLNARPKTKEASVNVCLMCIEIEKQDVVQEELIKGLTNKQPKIVVACTEVLRIGLEQFGAKVMNVKTLMKVLPSLFEHSDQGVRGEAKTLAVEMYKWLGAALKPSLEKQIKPVQLKELEDEWAKITGPPVPSRLLRSQQKAQATAIVTGGSGAVGGAMGVAQVVPVEVIDPYDLLEAVEVLSKLPADFYDKLADPQWKERKAVLETFLPIAQSPKIEGGDFGELIKALKKVICKDSNVLIVALAGNVVTGLAKGLRKKFQPYAATILAGIFEKFKEKKQNVVTSLREAADTVYLTTTIAGFQEEVIEALKDKNPSVKSETILFLARCFQQCTAAALPKPLLKTLCPVIVEKLDDTTPQVREAAFEAMGTLLKVMGDRAMISYVETIDKAKMAKIEEQRDKVELKVAAGVIAAPAAQPVAEQPPLPAEEPAKKKPVVKKAAPKPTDGGGSDGGGGPASTSDQPPQPPPSSAEPENKPVKKPPVKKVVKPEAETAAPTQPPDDKPPSSAAAGPKKAAAGGGGGKGAAGAGGKGKGAKDVGKDDSTDPPEPNLTPEEVDEKAAQILPAGMLDQLGDANWKTRLAACEQLQQFIDGLSPSDMKSLLFVKVLEKKPGWKDSNFQVMKAKLSIVALLAAKATVFGRKSAMCALPAVVEKLSDVKIKQQSVDTLMLMAEKLSLNFVSVQALKCAFEQKNPKVHSETLDWLGQALKEFGFLIDIKAHIEFIKTAMGASNPQVRTSAIGLLGVMHLFLRAQLRVFFEDEKPTVLQLIDAQFEKSASETAPAPIRGPSVKADNGDQDGGGEEAGGGAPAPVSLADLMPKVDISGQIKEQLITELGDKNWKIRNEALQKVQAIISEAKFIQPSLGELPGALKARLGDSNKNLVVTTLGIVSSLATSMGSACSKFVKAFIPGVFQTLTDSKPQLRAAGIATLNAWCTEATFQAFVDEEMLSTALNTENPNLRTELLGWLEEKLPTAGKLPPEIQSIIPSFFACLEDRSADVRKKAQTFLPVLAAKVGYDTLLKQTAKLKPASKEAVKAIVEKCRSAEPPKAAKPAAAAAQPSKPPEKAAVVEETPPQPEKVMSSPEKPPEAEQGSKRAQPGKAEKPAQPDKPAQPEKQEPPAKTDSGEGAVKKVTKSAKEKAAGKSKKDGDESTGPPLVFVPNGKEQRIKDEEKMKTLKWNFAAPRTEHMDQLKEQLQPCVSPVLFAQLFHEDFKQHLVALTTLTQCVTGDAPHKDAAVGCLDLLLRWVTLRFFDTNTTVNMKALEFVHAMFDLLVQDNYRMSDYEANAFVPYLVQKLGDSKEPIRKEVKVLLKDLCTFYPPMKLFPVVMEGLKSKNARQRTECLETLGLLIQNNGLSVCGSTPQKVVPLIAAQISDRDNAVRSAALNTLVMVYGNVGDQVYKLAGQLAEKDLSLLEERIRRVGKKAVSTSMVEQPVATSPPPEEKPVEPVAPEPPAQATPASSNPENLKIPKARLQAMGIGAKTSEVALDTPQTTAEPSPSVPSAVTPAAPPPEATGPFKVDLAKFSSMAPKFTPRNPKLNSIDQGALQDKTLDVLPSFATSKFVTNPPAPLTYPSSSVASTSTAVNLIISQITSSDPAASGKALKQVEVILSSDDQRPALAPHVDQLLRAVLMQMKLNFTTQFAAASDSEAKKVVTATGKRLTACLVGVFSQPSLACGVTQDTLVQVETDVMSYLVDDKLLVLEEVAQLNRSFNFLMLHVVDNSDKTAVFGSLLHVLMQSLAADGSSTKLTEMTMKCLWKVTRNLPQLFSQINADCLLRDIHLFFQAHAHIHPSPSSNDTPYRTVKTILFHVANIMGPEVMNHLTLIKDVKTSRVSQYLRKTLAKKRLSVEKEGEVIAVDSAAASKSADRAGPTSPFSKLPTSSAAVLETIFKKISEPNTTKEGLIELYQYKQQHADLDISVFLQGTTKFFQDYIARGLQCAELSLKEQPHVFSNPGVLDSDEHKMAVKTHEELNQRAATVMGIDWTNKPDASLSDIPTATGSQESKIEEKKKVKCQQNENMNPLALKAAAMMPVSTDKPPQPAVATPAATAAPPPGGLSVNLDDLRRRLERIKAST